MARLARFAATALVTLSVLAAPAAYAQARGGVQVSGQTTVTGIANNSVNMATGFLAKAKQDVGTIRGNAQVSGRTTVTGIANNTVNMATGFLSKACQSIGVIGSDPDC